MVFFVAMAGGRASAGGAALMKLKGNHPSMARLGPMVHADPAMRLHLTVVFAIHDQASSTSCSPTSRSHVRPIPSMANAAH